jgi:hypothetical protein
MADAIAAPAAVPAAPAAPAATAPKAAEGTNLSAAQPAPAKTDMAKQEATAEAQVDSAKAKAEARKLKVKVNGAEREISEEDLVRDYQTREAANERFKEAKALRESAEQKYDIVNKILETMKANPREFAERAKALGVDPLKLAEDILRPHVQELMEAEAEKEMTPEQLKARQMEKKLAEYERKEAEAQKAKELEAQKQKDVERQAVVDKHTQEFSGLIMAALKATSLPPNNELALEMVNMIAIAEEQGLSYDPQTLARDLEEREWSKANALAKNKTDRLDPEVRKAIMKEALNDPEIMELARKQAVEEYKKSNPMVASKPVSAPKNDRVASKGSRGTFNQAIRDLQLGRIK